MLFALFYEELLPRKKTKKERPNSTKHFKDEIYAACSTLSLAYLKLAPLNVCVRRDRAVVEIKYDGVIVSLLMIMFFFFGPFLGHISITEKRWSDERVADEAPLRMRRCTTWLHPGPSGRGRQQKSPMNVG